jgi:hypothetical protein
MSFQELSLAELLWGWSDVGGHKCGRTQTAPGGPVKIDGNNWLAHGIERGRALCRAPRGTLL